MDAPDLEGPFLATRGGDAVGRLSFEKLKPGPSLSPEQVRANQRRRLHRALIEMVDEKGYERLTVRALTARAGVSTRTFYKHFENIDACLGSTYRQFMSEALRRSAEEQRGTDGWHSALRTGIYSLMEAFATDPKGTRLALVEIYDGGPSPRREIGAVFSEIEELLAGGFVRAPRLVVAPRHLIAGMAAGVIRIARKTALAGRCHELPALADDILEWMLTLPHPELLRLQGQLRTGGGVRRPRREPSPYPADETGLEDQIAAGDRGRVLRATAKLAAADGFAELTAPKIRSEAGVSRRQFDASFTGVTSCFLEAVSMVVTAAARRGEAWACRETGWERQTSKFVLALAAQASRDRGLGRLAFGEIYAAGRAGLLQREALIHRGALELRTTVPETGRPADLIAEASVAAAWHIAQADAAAGRTRGLPLVAPLLSYVLLAPVVGPETAASAIHAEFSPAVHGG
jgi:AcrR family transcriptional regulator